jgi:hypothetical protein
VARSTLKIILAAAPEDEDEACDALALEALRIAGLISNGHTSGAVKGGGTWSVTRSEKREA